MSRRVRKAAVAIICIGGLLILSAALLAGYNIWDDYRAGRAARRALERAEGAFAGDTAPDYLSDPNREMPAVEIDGYRYVGTVRVPSVGLALPVMETWDYRRMRIAPCRYSGTVYLNNMVICAHNYASHFGRLKNMSAGDEVTFTDMDGNVFRYKAVKVETLAGTAVREMTGGAYDLTLFTCTFDGRARVTVRCDRAAK